MTTKDTKPTKAAKEPSKTAAVLAKAHALANRVKAKANTEAYLAERAKLQKAKTKAYAADRAKRAKAKVEAGVKRTRAQVRAAGAKVTPRNGEVLPSAKGKGRAKPKATAETKAYVAELVALKAKTAAYGAKKVTRATHVQLLSQWRDAVAAHTTELGFTDWTEQVAVHTWKLAVAHDKTLKGLADWRS